MERRPTDSAGAPIFSGKPLQTLDQQKLFRIIAGEDPRRMIRFPDVGSLYIIGLNTKTENDHRPDQRFACPAQR